MKNIHNISAGAGSGKTTRLVSIITDLVAGKMGQKCSPERMILTTFTKAAANEFKERAAARLMEEGFLAEAVTLDAAMIGTIHSIAQAYITRYWYLCGMSPDVCPVTEAESAKMLVESLSGLVDPDDYAFFRKYVREFGLTKGSEGYYDDFWKDHLLQLSEFLMFEPDKEKRLKDIRDKSMSMLSAMFDAGHNAELIRKARECAEAYLRYCQDDTLYNKNSAGKVARHTKVAETILDAERKSYTLGQLKGMCDDLGKEPFSLKKDKKDSHEAAVIAAHAAFLESVKRIIPDEASWIPQCAEKICDIALKWMDGYRALKKSSGVIDFSDMEVLFLELLGKKEVLEDIRSSIDYLFVDEFQDCNPVQIRIFEILSENVRQSWFVGDPKQAIYGFRGSNVELVNKFSSSFPKDVEDKASFTGFKKDDDGLSSEILDKSYRSHPTLVDLSNKVFMEAFSSDLAKENIRLESGRESYETKYPVIHHICLNGKNDAVKCDALASGITMVLNGTYPRLEDMQVSPSDIAVLVRSNSRAVNVAASLKKNGVPVSYVDTAFRDSAEVSLLLSLLRLATGRQNRKSKAELMSLIDGLGLHDLLIKVAGNDLDNFWGGLHQFLKSAKTLSVVDLVDAVIARFNLYDYVSCWGYADIRRANIDLVCQIARQFDSSASTFANASDLLSFLTYIESYEPEAKFNNQDSGVKVLTYHKSKGLEWKVVFLADIDGDLDEKTSLRGLAGLQGDILVPALPSHEPVWLAEAVTADGAMQRLLASVSLKNLGEERRLLYVGLTRARDFVFTVGSEGKGMRKLHQCCPSAAAIDYSEVGNDEFDIWGVGVKSCCYQCAPDPVRYVGADSQPSRVKDAGFMLPESEASETYEPKCHIPSKYKDPAAIAATSPEIMKTYSRMSISHGHVADNEFGDCVHAIYAVGSHPDKARRLAAAERTLQAYGLDAGCAEALVDRFDDLCGYLREAYGDPARGVDHELPFIYEDTQGRVFSGNMDMVWKTKDSSVIVDYKTFSGTQEAAMKECAEKHASQMKLYRAALEAAGEAVDAVLILYPVLGLIVKVN